MSGSHQHRERPPLRIRPRPSRRLALFLISGHLAALVIACALPLDWYWRLGLAAAVLTGLVYGIGAHVLYLTPWSVREATWNSDGAWTLALVSGRRIDARLLPSTYVTRSLQVLNFRTGRWQYRTLTLLPDALDGDLLRRLRVRLRLARAGSGPDTDAPA
jgi:hypothetical protein